MKKILLTFFVRVFGLAACALLASGCTDAELAKGGGYGKPFRIEVLSGGQVVRTYLSTGKVVSEGSSDGYYFTDAATGELVELSGQVIITQLRK
jgi:hypothetical protein